MFNTTIDSLIADFVKTRDKLLALSDKHAECAVNYQKAADKRAAISKAHTEASVRATKLAANITKIID